MKPYLSKSLPVATRIAAAVAAVLAGSYSVSAQTSGAFTFANVGTGNSDALVGLSTSKTYLDAYNLNDTANLTINGVLFTGINGANPAVPGVFSTTGLTSVFNGGGTNPGGVLGTLTNKFVYGSLLVPEVYTYSNLVVGQTYVITYYNRSWEAAATSPTVGGRRMNLSAGGASTGTYSTYDEDNGATAQGSLNVLRYTFQATGTSQTITLTNLVSGTTEHNYGFTLEQTFNNNWTGGTSASTSTWSVAPPLIAGSNANFGAQPTPTTFDLDIPVTLGHVQFNGTNAWTITGANTLTLQADVGGAVSLSALAGSHTISPNITLASSSLLKLEPVMHLRAKHEGMEIISVLYYTLGVEPLGWQRSRPIPPTIPAT